MAYGIRVATKDDDALIAGYFQKMWAEYEADELLADSWLNDTLAFIENAREGLEYSAYIAEANGETIGCAACQVFAGLYPSVFQPEKRKYGYIWGVYVVSKNRGKGVARALTEACRDHLKGIGCTKIVLHASPMGRPVYEKLGFETSNEMSLELK